MGRMEWFAGVASRGLREPAEVWAYGAEPVRGGYMAEAVLLVRRPGVPDDRAFSTHLVVTPGSAPDAAYMVSGVYDLTLAEGWQDFTERCDTLKRGAAEVAVSREAQDAGVLAGGAA